MASEPDKVKPDTVLTARVALIVGVVAALTTLIGAGIGVLGSHLATSESNKQDSARLHAEQVQADRTELRTVLDRAATALYVVRARFASLENKRYRDSPGLSEPGFKRFPPVPTSELATLKRQADLLGESFSRVTLRLGRSHPATKLMAAALNDATMLYELLRDRTRYEDSASVDEKAEFERGFRGYTRHTDQFVDAANSIARSRTQ